MSGNTTINVGPSGEPDVSEPGYYIQLDNELFEIVEVENRIIVDDDGSRWVVPVPSKVRRGNKAPEAKS